MKTFKDLEQVNEKSIGRFKDQKGKDINFVEDDNGSLNIFMKNGDRYQVQLQGSWDFRKKPKGGDFNLVPGK